MKLKKVVRKIMQVGLLNSLALFLVIENVNPACMWVFYEPKMPKQANKYKHF